MKLSAPKPLRRLAALRPRLCASLCALPLVLLNGALVQVAQAQSSGAPAAAPSALSSLVSTLSIFAFFALLIGLVRPKTFAFLFKEQATRGRVCGVFGAAWFFLVILGGPLRPKRVATETETVPTTTVAQSAPPSNAAPGKSSDAVRLAENRAKAAEARAARAEKAAASANADAHAASKGSGRRVANRESAPVEATDTPGFKVAPKNASQPSNVDVVDIEGVGKREAGVVDDVVYMVGKAETTPALGPQMYRREADGVFYVLQVAANNTTKTTHDVTTLLMKLVDDQGREFDPSTEGSTALAATGDQSAQMFSAQLQPRVTKKFTLVYDAPADAKGLKLKIPAGGFGFGKSASIRVPTANE